MNLAQSAVVVDVELCAEVVEGDGVPGDELVLVIEAKAKSERDRGQRGAARGRKERSTFRAAG